MLKRYASRIFSHSTLPGVPRQGSLLVAEPFLGESYFRHAVISLIDNDSKTGIMGVVMNHGIELSLSEIVEGVKTDVPVFCGGPLAQDRVYFIHNLGDTLIADSTEYAPGLWIGGDFDSALDYVNKGYPTDGCIRFFLGYSGWDNGQLDDELSQNVWAVGESQTLQSTTLLSLNGDTMWHHAVKALGPYYRTWNLHPLSPMAN